MSKYSPGTEARPPRTTLEYERHCPEQTLLYQLVERYYPQFADLREVQGVAQLCAKNI